MTVFKTFFKIVNKYKGIILMYTIILVAFGGINIKTNDNNTNFVASKPDVLIINNDENEGVTKNLIEYIEKNSNIIEIKDNEEAINDALFYRDVNYIIYIPENYRQDFLKGLNPQIEVKSTGDYQASLAEMMLSRYMKVANVYIVNIEDEEELIEKINETLSQETEIAITSKLDTDNLSKAAAYYNFFNYSILGGCVYVICLILSTFREEKIFKRTTISSMNYKKHNRDLLIANAILAIILWAVYVVLSIILIGDIMLTTHGLIYALNSLVFTICALTIAFLIGNILNNKDAINGIIQVVGLGSSFLCGAFVPVEWLPDTILKIAHILPSYWFIQNNELIKTLEEINFETLKPVFVNMGVVLIFSLGFVIVTNIISKKKRKIE